MNWETRIDKIIHNLSIACYVIRSVNFNDVSTFKTIYYAYFHSVMEYGIVFSGKSTKPNQTKPNLVRKFSKSKKKKKKNCMNNGKVTN